MRFDNPIYDHGFVFPDIADFPDVKHERHYMGNGHEEYVSVMKEGIQEGDSVSCEVWIGINARVFFYFF